MLEKLFQRKGFTVIWNQNDTVKIEDFGFERPKVQTQKMYDSGFERLRVSNLILFFQRKGNVIFFVYGKRKYEYQVQTEHQISLKVPAEGEVWLLKNGRGGGEFALGSYEELARLFPYPEVHALDTRPLGIFYGSMGVSIFLILTTLIVPLRNKATRSEPPAPYSRVEPVVVLPKPENPEKTARPEPAKVISISSGALEERRTSLLNKLKKLVEETEDPGKKDRLEELLRRVEKEPRIRLVQYAIEYDATAILEGRPSEVSQSKKVEAKAAKEVFIKRPSAIDLPIEEYVPPDLAKCIKCILTMILNPAHQAPFIGEHRARKDTFRRKICRQVSPEMFERAFDWLERQGVLKGVNLHGGHSWSLTPRQEEAKTPAGKAIIGLVIRARREIVKNQVAMAL